MASLLAYYLSFWARLLLRRTGVRIVAITGSVGKTTTKEAVGAVLESEGIARVVEGNLNGPPGVALGLLGGDWDRRYYESGGGAWFWFRAACAAPGRALFARPKERFIVAEYGADRPGDIGWLVKRFPPHVAVVTAIGDVPVHLEYYASRKEVAAEKAKLLSRLGAGDVAVLNHDDLTVLEMREHVRGSVITFGLSEGAQVRAAGIELLTDTGVPEGVTFMVHTDGSALPVKVYGGLGRSQAYAACAAIAIAYALGVEPGNAVLGLANYRPPAGRLRLLKGIKDTTVLDDTYNASPLAVHNALDVLKEVPAKRRVAVLGDMLELGGETIAAHQAIGDMAGSIADMLVCVGDRSIFIADSAANQMPTEHIHRFHDADGAKAAAQELLEPGDVVLVKGSQGMRMERIVREIMAEPERAAQLLVRQSKRWLSKK